LHERPLEVHKGTESWTSAGWTSKHELLHLGLKDHALALLAIQEHDHLFYKSHDQYDSNGPNAEL
jgi:hypothetical protein